MSRGQVLRVGLTGGVGSGKTTVSDLFAGKGVPIIDTDVIARELVEPGTPALAEIAGRFGRAVMTADGRLDRAALRRIVFADSHARRDLEGILHPRIRKETAKRVQQLQAPYCIIVIPLLVESGMLDAVDRILVVDVDPEIQVRRTAARDGISEEQAKAIKASQATREERLAVAHDILDNSGDPAALEPEVERLHRQYLKMASRRG